MLQLNKKTPTDVSFTVEVEGLTDTTGMEVRLIINDKAVHYTFLCKRGSENNYHITVPPFDHLDVNTIPYHIEVLAQGYYFKAYEGNIKFVNEIEVTNVTEPTSVGISTNNANEIMNRTPDQSKPEKVQKHEEQEEVVDLGVKDTQQANAEPPKPEELAQTFKKSDNSGPVKPPIKPEPVESEHSEPQPVKSNNPEPEESEEEKMARLRAIKAKKHKHNKVEKPVEETVLPDVSQNRDHKNVDSLIDKAKKELQDIHTAKNQPVNKSDKLKGILKELEEKKTKELQNLEHRKAAEEKLEKARKAKEIFEQHKAQKANDQKVKDIVKSTSK